MSDDDSDQNEQNARLDRWAQDNDGQMDGGPIRHGKKITKEELRRQEKMQQRREQREAMN